MKNKTIVDKIPTIDFTIFLIFLLNKWKFYTLEEFNPHIG